ncbi:trypsin-like peptidase domain-containing protein [Geobacter sp. SVR]|uniref:trypsin-like peptidase domain-containing protein n=1 Tax=Geobacter sp. SVR TaxID=2495594 RepID=UPI001563352B|nr:trypsin-like peptidase domain-containing protein [Geobacter sp. SVR]
MSNKLLIVFLPFFLLVSSAIAEDATGKVTPEILRCVVKLETNPDASGKYERGTGFFVSESVSRGGKQTRRTFLVTNKHMVGDWTWSSPVIKNYKDYINAIVYTVHPIEGKYYKKLRVNIKERDNNLNHILRIHPNPNIDVVIFDLTEEIDKTDDLNIRSFDVSYLMPFYSISDQLIGIGDQVFALGYPFGISSVKHNFPIAKSGYIASIPSEPFYSQVLIDEDSDQPVIKRVAADITVIDGLIVPGNSGGPVILANELKSRRDPKTNQVQFSSKQTENYIIGIVSYGFSGSGLSFVFSTDYIRSLIETYIEEKFPVPRLKLINDPSNLSNRDD